MREIESIQKNFLECIAEEKLRASFNEEIDTVIEEVPCIVEKRGSVHSRDEEESFRNTSQKEK